MFMGLIFAIAFNAKTPAEGHISPKDEKISDVQKL
jgi:hypothetical protein